MQSPSLANSLPVNLKNKSPNVGINVRNDDDQQKNDLKGKDTEIDVDEGIGKIDVREKKNKRETDGSRDEKKKNKGER
jgi:type 1 fimbria pilin